MLVTIPVPDNPHPVVTSSSATCTELKAEPGMSISFSTAENKKKNQEYQHPLCPLLKHFHPPETYPMNYLHKNKISLSKTVPSSNCYLTMECVWKEALG